MKNILFTLFLLFGLAAAGLSQNVESVLIRIQEHARLDEDGYLIISVVNEEGDENKTIYNKRNTESINKNIFIKKNTR